MPPGKRGPGRKEPRWSAERRAGQRHWPVDLRVCSREIGPTARRATGAAFRAQRLSALCPPHFGEEKEDGASPRRKEKGTSGALAETTSMRESKNRCALFSPYPAGGGSTPRRGGGVGFAPQARSRGMRNPTRLAALADLPLQGRVKKCQWQLSALISAEYALAASVGTPRPRLAGGRRGATDLDRRLRW